MDLYLAREIIKTFDEKQKERWCYWIKDINSETKPEWQCGEAAKEFLEYYKDSLDE